MKAKSTAIRLMVKWTVLIFCVFTQKLGYTQTISEDVSEAGFSYNPYLTVSLALLFTFLTVFAISMLARYIRETSGDQFNGFEDSEP
ncbi:MAG: hypothetical protein EYC69_06575 [Bacteroidetes bacterium]|nr:MAG: hypothetical protein EYC69_06575 [Bacteroidota bacterium]